jgi:hypothetical protein
MSVTGASRSGMLCFQLSHNEARHRAFSARHTRCDGDEGSARVERAGSLPSRELIRYEMLGTLGLFTTLHALPFQCSVSVRKTWRWPPVVWRRRALSENLETTVGPIPDLPVPRTRKGYRTQLFERYHRRREELDGEIGEMFVKGVSQAQVGRVIEMLTGSHPSPSAVSRVFHTLEDEDEQWKRRPLCEQYAYAFADGICFTVFYNRIECKMPDASHFAGATRLGNFPQTLTYCHAVIPNADEGLLPTCYHLHHPGDEWPVYQRAVAQAPVTRDSAPLLD